MTKYLRKSTSEIKVLESYGIRSDCAWSPSSILSGAIVKNVLEQTWLSLGSQKREDNRQKQTPDKMLYKAPSLPSDIISSPKPCLLDFPLSSKLAPLFRHYTSSTGLYRSLSIQSITVSKYTTNWFKCIYRIRKSCSISKSNGQDYYWILYHYEQHLKISSHYPTLKGSRFHSIFPKRAQIHLIIGINIFASLFTEISS